jgi:hypothetical protein
VAKDLEPVKIRLRLDVGMFHNTHNVKRGDVVEVEASNARRYFATGVPQPAHVKELGPAYQPYKAA